MAVITWQNGGVDNNWSTAGNWDLGRKPAAGDDVVIAAAYNCVVNENTANLNSFDMNGYANTLSGTSTITVQFSTATTSTVRFAGTISWTGVLNLNPTNASGVINFYSGGKTIDRLYTGISASASGTVNQMDALTVTQGALIGTHYNSGGYSVTCLYTQIYNYVRTQDYTNSTINCSRTSGAAWTGGGASNTLTMTGTTLNISGSAADFATAGKTYATVNITGGGSIDITGTPTIATLNVTGTAVKTDELTLADSTTVTGTLNIDGNSATNRILVRSSALGTARTLTVTGATISGCSYVDFQDITFTAGGGNVNLSSITGGSGDCGGNSISGGGTLSFTTATDQHWIDADGGNWSDSGNWTSRIPLPQDNAIFDCAFNTSKTVTLDAASPLRTAANIDWSGATYTTALTWTISDNFIMYGSTTLKSGMTVSGAGKYFDMAGRGTNSWTGNTVVPTVHVRFISYGGTVNFNGNLSGQLWINTPTGTVNLAADLDLNNNGIYIQQGTFDTQEYDITSCGTFNFGGTTTKTITIENSSIELEGSGTGASWSAHATGTTLNANGSTILYRKLTVSTNFAGAGLTYGALVNENTTGGITFTGSNTFSSITCNYNGSNAKTMSFTSGTTQTVGDFIVTGQAGKLITLNAVTAGSPATISASGTVSVSYADVKDLTASGTSAPFSATDSTDSGGNTNWNFGAAPVVTARLLSLLGVGS